MAGNAITTAIFLVLVVADVSNASSFWKLRYLADEYPAKDNTTDAGPANSSSPIPLSGAKDLDPKANSTSKLDPGLLNQTDSATPPPNEKEDSKESAELERVSPPPKKDIDGGSNSSSSSNSTNDKPTKDTEKKKENVHGGKNPNNTQTGKGAESKEDKEEEKNRNGDQGAETKKDKEEEKSTNGDKGAQTKEDKEEEKNTNGDKTDSKSVVVETCDGVGVADSCTDGHYLSACIKDPGTGSHELIVLVLNSGSKTLKVSLTGLSDKSKAVEVQKHGAEKINISLPISKSSKLVLSAGKEDCELLVKPEGNFVFNLPSYDKLVTPVNGAYFLIVTVVIFGASWACCMFRKRRRHDGIPYQELELGLPESMAAADVETAEGWDEVWDDDWDEDKAVKSPAEHHVRNISANGLTARSSNRDDGWENDWDD